MTIGRSTSWERSIWTRIPVAARRGVPAASASCPFASSAACVSSAPLPFAAGAALPLSAPCPLRTTTLSSGAPLPPPNAGSNSRRSRAIWCCSCVCVTKRSSVPKMAHGGKPQHVQRTVKQVHRGERRQHHHGGGAGGVFQAAAPERDVRGGHDLRDDR